MNYNRGVGEDPKKPTGDDELELPPTDRFVPVARWRVAVARPDEAARWTCMDGRSVTVIVGHGDDIGTVLVRSSDGRCERLDSYEEALAIAKSWQT